MVSLRLTGRKKGGAKKLSLFSLLLHLSRNSLRTCGWLTRRRVRCGNNFDASPHFAKFQYFSVVSFYIPDKKVHQSRTESLEGKMSHLPTGGKAQAEATPLTLEKTTIVNQNQAVTFVDLQLYVTDKVCSL